MNGENARQRLVADRGKGGDRNMRQEDNGYLPDAATRRRKEAAVASMIGKEVFRLQPKRDHGQTNKKVSQDVYGPGCFFRRLLFTESRIAAGGIRLWSLGRRLFINQLIAIHMPIPSL